jgi:hypothetical protein
LDVGPALAFRVEQFRKKTCFGISFDPLSLTIEASKQLRGLSATLGPFLFKSSTVAGSIYDSYVIDHLADLWRLANSVVIGFARKAAQSATHSHHTTTQNFCNFF